MVPLTVKVIVSTQFECLTGRIRVVVFVEGLRPGPRSVERSGRIHCSQQALTTGTGSANSQKSSGENMSHLVLNGIACQLTVETFHVATTKVGIVR
jgi:hypothetical protein